MKDIGDAECNECYPDCDTTDFGASASAAPFRRCDYKNVDMSPLCTIETDSVFITLSPINTVHIGKLNIFGLVILQSDQPTCFRFSVYGLASLHCVISLRYTFGDATLTQNILERRVNKAIYKKVATES